jgi:hypothetical protein
MISLDALNEGSRISPECGLRSQVTRVLANCGYVGKLLT